MPPGIHMSQRNAVEHFDQRAPDWDRLYSKPQFVDRRQLFVSLVKRYAPTASHILDYGCGTGAISRALAEQGFSVESVDPSDQMIHHATEQSPNSTNPSYEVIDPERWRAARNYDAAVCSSVIEYVPDDIEMLTKLSDALVDGGYLFISMPSAHSWLGKIEDLIKYALGRDSRYAQRRYSDQDIRTSMEKSGLKMLNSVYFEFPFLGRVGVGLSRIRYFGVMRLVVAVKQNT